MNHRLPNVQRKALDILNLHMQKHKDISIETQVKIKNNQKHKDNSREMQVKIKINQKHKDISMETQVNKHSLNWVKSVL